MIVKKIMGCIIPRTTRSRKWHHWKATIDLKICSDCMDHHGKVYAVDEHIPQEPPLHPFCRCELELMEAIELGWRSSKPLSKFAPGKMLFGGVYSNQGGKLPSAPKRVWWEADWNYYSGRRNKHRIYFSSDGLIFVSYDHGITFYEIV